MGIYIILMGLQGAGKGTQAKFLAEKYAIPHISTGDLFRAMKTEDTPLARRVQALMADGQLIPDEITNEMVQERLSKPDAANGAILDGYPRTPQQAGVFDSYLEGRGEGVTRVLLLELERDLAFKRATGRWFSQDMQRVYNIYFDPPKNPGVDDVDGLDLIQREDDKPEKVNTRLDLYYQATTPLIEYYEQRSKLARINADQTIEQVRDEIFNTIDSTRVSS